MKTTLLTILLTATAGVALAQDAQYPDYQPAAYVVPAVVYQAPVIYTAPVLYQAPVIYNAPVYYGTPASCALNACSACQDFAVRSTVAYIGGGRTRYQVSSPCNNGSTVTLIGQSWGH